MPDVYATAHGPLARLAAPLAARARSPPRRFFALTRLPPHARVLDVGCGSIGLRALEPQLDITGVDLAERPDYPGPFVRADAAAGLPFADGEFDLVYCSSVVEHVPPARRAAFAAEIRRVGRGWFVQTPRLLLSDRAAFASAGRALAAVGLRRPTGAWAPPGSGRRSRCLGAREMEQLFGPALAERFGPLVKSWVCVRAPDGP